MLNSQINHDSLLTSQNLAPSQQKQTVEHLLDKVNGQGKYQFISIVIFTFLWFIAGWLLLGMTFFFDDYFECKNPNLDEESCINYICGLDNKIRKHHIRSHAKSITFQFQHYMICQFENQVPILQSMIFIGSFVGFFAIPYIGDNWGRKIALIISWMIATIAVGVVYIADSPKMVGLGLFFVGFGVNPAITTTLSLINQQCLYSTRQRYSIAVQIAFGVGQIVIALIFMTSINWRMVWIMIAVMFVVGLVLIYFCVVQSPMFEMQKNAEKALTIFNEIARINKRAPLALSQIHQVTHGQIHQNQKVSVAFFDLFRYKSLRWCSISSGLVFLAIQTIYYSTSLNLDVVGFTKTINQIIFGVSECIGLIFADFIIHKVKRKKASFYGLGISSLMCIALGILVSFETQQNLSYFKWIEAGGLMINRFVLCGFWTIFYIYVAELYPTQIRSLGFGWTSTMGMIGSTASPYVAKASALVGISSWFPPALVGFIAWMFIPCLPQTHGLPLKTEIPQKIQQMQKKLLLQKVESQVSQRSRQRINSRQNIRE